MLAAVEGGWRVLKGVGGPLSVPTCFGLDMSIRRGLGYVGGFESS